MHATTKRLVGAIYKHRITPSAKRELSTRGSATRQKVAGLVKKMRKKC